ncbi:MAG: glycosyltransferase family 1 protein [bacterium]|nr:glycosyltransferase family 1 protein [bacterium]
MRIGIHAKALSEKNPTGVSVYARNLLARMLVLPEAKAHEWTLYTDGEIAKNTKYQMPALSHVEGPNTKYRTLHTPFLWTQVRLAWELYRHMPDVFFTPQHVLPLSAPKNSVVTIHGLEYERYPQYYSWHTYAYLRGVTKDAVKRATRIIAVSEATKRDLMDLYKVLEEKIFVIHHGAPDLQNHRSQITNYKQNNEPYFLYLGRIELKKNVDGIIKAFAIVKEKYKLPHTLVLAGGEGYGAENIKHDAWSMKHKNDICFLGYVSEQEKWALLKGATAFMFPSWCEGFGLPVLEAQSAGVPVITSNISAMPEVGGKAALYIDPADPESIADAMDRVAKDRKLRNDLIEAGYENIKRFSWDRCAAETLAVLIK